MVHMRALRHASLLLLFLALLFVGVVFENAFDTGDGGYAEDARELRDGGVPFRTVFHSAAHWRHVPLTLNRADYPYVTDAFAREFLQRTAPPQLADVRDNRTLMSADFYDELQLWRRPGQRAAQMLEVMRAQVEEERVAARAEAIKRRNGKAWHVKKAPAASLISRLWPSFLRRSGDASEAAQARMPSPFVDVHYASAVLFHGMGGAARNAVNASRADANRKAKKADDTPHGGNDDGGGGAKDPTRSETAQRQAVSLETDAVELIPFPFVPYTHFQGVGAAEAEGELGHPERAVDAGVPVQPLPVTQVRIDKGKLRYTVPRRVAPHQPTHGWDHFYIALNLWKNEDVIPDLTEALIVFLTDEVKPFFDLATSVVVSIYANVSPDRTAELIEAILIPRLHAVGIRVVYATTEGSCLGYVERRPFHERIEWMACIRNKALAPLYEKGMRVFNSGDADAAAAAAANKAELHSDGLVVLFFNDIFFRPQDITTLLESQAEAQMVEEVRPHGWVASALDTAVTTPANVPGTPTVPTPTLNESTRRTSGTTFDMACGMDFYFTFYDTWVTRDRLGNPFEAQMPYSDDHATQGAFYRIFKHGREQRHSRGKGKNGPDPHTKLSERQFQPETAAVPVKCCWNGVAAIRGRFFLPPTADHRHGFPETVSRYIAPVVQEDAVEEKTENDAVVGAAAGKQPMMLQDGKGRGVRASLQPSLFPDAHGGAPPVLQRPSGALYDLLGTVQDAVKVSGVADYYTRVLARRLQSERMAWNATRGEIAELTRHPFYQPVVYANMSSFTTLLEAVLQETGSRASGFDILTLALTLNTTNSTIAPSLVAIIADLQQRDGAVVKETVGARQGSIFDVRASEDSTYYVARHPAVRFRHAFTPSYGATVRGLKPVRDDVCLSSECLLICQDVMQAAVLQDRRAPVILLNPHVRVAYDLEHFERITRHTWFFEHPVVYWTWAMARRVQLWWSTGSTSGVGAGVQHGAEVRELGEATSATDDWLRRVTRDATTTTAMKDAINTEEDKLLSTRQKLVLEDGKGNVVDVGVVDIPTLTRMACQRITAGSIGLAVGAFFPVFRLAQLLLVALLLRWLCWSAQADVARKLNASSDSAYLARSGGATAAGVRENRLPGTPSPNAKALSVEEQWWRVMYTALWLSPPARHIRSWIDALAEDDGLSSSISADYEGLSDESGRRVNDLNNLHEAVYLSRNGRTSPIRGGGAKRSANSRTPSPLPAVPVLHLQLRQYYRRRKLAATLDTCAYKSRCVLRSAARVVLWLLGMLCCVRCWCGCRAPGPPPAPSLCAETRCGVLWTRHVVGSSDVCSAKKQRRCSQTLADVEKSSRGETQGAWSCASVSSPADAAVRWASPQQHSSTRLAESAQQRFDVSTNNNNNDNGISQQGSRANSPACSPVSSPTAGMFREFGDEMESWAAQQQLRQSRPPPWQMRGPQGSVFGVPQLPHYPQGPPVSHGSTNPLVTPLAGPIARVDSPVTTSLLRSDGPFGSGGALQSVRPRKTSARMQSCFVPLSPNSPAFGGLSGGRPGDLAGVPESTIHNI